MLERVRVPRYRVAALMAALARESGDRKQLEAWLFEVVTYALRGDRAARD